MPEESRIPGWIIHGISEKDGKMKYIDLNSTDFEHLHDTIKKVYKTLKEKNKVITPVQISGMYSIMMDRPSMKSAARTARAREVNDRTQKSLLHRGGYMNGARKKSKRRKSKRRKSKKRKTKKRKSKRRS